MLKKIFSLLATCAMLSAAQDPKHDNLKPTVFVPFIKRAHTAAVSLASDKKTDKKATYARQNNTYKKKAKLPNLHVKRVQRSARIASKAAARPTFTCVPAVPLLVPLPVPVLVPQFFAGVPVTYEFVLYNQMYPDSVKKLSYGQLAAIAEYFYVIYGGGPIDFNPPLRLDLELPETSPFDRFFRIPPTVPADLIPVTKGLFTQFFSSDKTNCLYQNGRLSLFDLEGNNLLDAQLEVVLSDTAIAVSKIENGNVEIVDSETGASVYQAALSSIFILADFGCRIEHDEIQLWHKKQARLIRSCQKRSFA